MATEHLDYSDYLRHMSNISRIGALFAGFDFTVVTLLLTRLPDPRTPLAQVTLYAMSALFFVLIFVVGWSGMLHIYLCRRVPPMTPRLRAFAIVSFAAHVLICAPPAVMFLLWDLPVLASATFLTWIVYVALSLIYIWRPLTRFTETRKYFLQLP